MRKTLVFMLLFFLISISSFPMIISSVSASDTEDFWNTKTPMTHERYNVGVIAVGGKIYAVGGTNDTLDDLDGLKSFFNQPEETRGKTCLSIIGRVVNTNECYDPATDTWTTKAPMPTPRHDFAIAEYQGKIYCIGGRNSDGSSYVNEVYDTTTDTWATLTPIPFDGYSGIQAHVINGKIYVLVPQVIRETSDKYISRYGYALHVCIYDPISDTWTEKTNSLPFVQPTPTFAISVVVDDKIMVMSEFYTELISNSQWNRNEYNKVVVYDPKTDRWIEETTCYPPEGFGFSAVGITSGRRVPQCIYFFRTDSTADSTVVYDPLNNSWSTAKPIPASGYARYYDVAVIDDTFYLIGGDKDIEHFLADESAHVTLQYVPNCSSVTLFSTNTISQLDSFSLYNNLIIVALALIVGIAVVSLVYAVFHKKKLKQKKTGETHV